MKAPQASREVSEVRGDSRDVCSAVWGVNPEEVTELSGRTWCPAMLDGAVGVCEKWSSVRMESITSSERCNIRFIV